MWLYSENMQQSGYSQQVVHKGSREGGEKDLMTKKREECIQIHSEPSFVKISVSSSLSFLLEFSTAIKLCIISPTKVHLIKAMVFSVVMYGCESWSIKKAKR